MDNKITTEKLDEVTLRVVKTLPVQFDYKLDYLVEQRQRIVEQKDRDNAQRDLEIAECDDLISNCGELEIKSEKAIETEKVVEPIPIEV